MPQFNSYNKDGRTLLVRFTCCRCGKTHTDELEPLDKKAEDHYRNLSNLPLPNGWSDWLIHSRLLCDGCTAKLIEFFEKKKEEQET